MKVKKKKNNRAVGETGEDSLAMTVSEGPMMNAKELRREARKLVGPMKAL